jgi:hypothetical protein
VRSDSGVDRPVSSSRIGDDERHVKGDERREGDSDRDLERDVVRDVDRFGVGDTDKGLGMTGDGGVTSGTVATGIFIANVGSVGMERIYVVFLNLLRTCWGRGGDC